MVWSLLKHQSKFQDGEEVAYTPASLWPSAASAIRTLPNGETQFVGKCRRSAFFDYIAGIFKYENHYKLPNYERWQELATQIASLATPKSPELLRIFEQGEIYEESKKRQIMRAGLFQAEQLRVFSPRLEISGKIDLVARNPETGKKTIVEVKSTNSYKFDSITGLKDKAPPQPLWSNLLQLALYQLLHGDKFDSYEEGRLVYGARDFGQEAEFLVKISESPKTILYKLIVPYESAWIDSGIAIDTIAKHFQDIRNAEKTQTIPPRDYDPSYTEEKITSLMQAGKLSKTNNEKHQKYLTAQEAGKKLKLLELSDKECNQCDHRELCKKLG